MPGTAKAWLLHVGENQQIAVGEMQMVEYILRPQLIEIPLTPPYCKHVINWRKQCLPILDFGVLMGEAENTKVEHAGVVRYQKGPRMPLLYLGLALNKEPEKITVDDSQLCDLPAQFLTHMRPTVLSCFSNAELPTPVLDFAYLCSTPFRELQESLRT